MVNLLSLNTLLAVLDSGSLMEAGRTVCRTQSAVSRAIRLPEGEFGTPLLCRSTSGAMLRAEDEAIEPRMHAVIERLSVWNVERRRIGARGIPQAVLNARRLELFWAVDPLPTDVGCFAADVHQPASGELCTRHGWFDRCFKAVKETFQRHGFDEVRRPFMAEPGTRRLPTRVSVAIRP